MNYYQKFDDDLRELFLTKLRENEDFGAELWAALTDVTWYHKDDTENNKCGYSSFRVAGGVISYMLCRTVDYMGFLLDDNCSSGVVSEYIASAMASKGWRYET